MVDWAMENLPKAEIEEFNEATKTHDRNTIKLYGARSLSTSTQELWEDQNQI